ncbi:MAG: amidohydrolase [Candidatus Korobacteraceae bacterium]
MTRRSAVLTSVLATLFSVGIMAAQEQSQRISVFVAKKIITMDPGWPEATAVAVRDGKIVSVGSLDDLKPWLDKNPYKIDRTFADMVLLPGFVEPHGHPFIGGTALTLPLLTYLPMPSPYGPGFPGVKTRQEAAAKLKEYVAQAKAPDDTVFSWGYDLIAMGGQHLDKTMLDKISATQPILVWDASEHFVYANTAAMKKYGITKADTTINGVMAGPDGEPNGQFLGVTAAGRILAAPMGELAKPAIALKNMKYLMDLSRKNGVTTTSELDFGALNIELEQGLFDQTFNNPQMPIRCVVVTDGAAMMATKGDQAIPFVQSLTKKNTDKLIFHGVKFFADDSFLSLGMVMENPGYIDGRQGIFLTPPDKMVETWLPWWKAGFQINVHTNGNGGNQATINALEALLKAYPRTDHRFAFQHFGISTPEMTRQVKVLGGVVSTNPYYVYARSEFGAPYFGSDRAYTAARLKTLIDAGVVTSMHTDTAVAPPVPLEELWIAVNRFGLSGHVRAPEERITLDQALRMVTIDAAYTLGAEKKVGSIQAGKLADFVVLEQDPHAVPVEKIRDIKVWGTVSGGRIFPASEIRP